MPSPSYEEIVSTEDQKWAIWKQIYYDSFPEQERMSDEFFARVFEEKASGAASDKHILLIREGPEVDAKPIGIAYYEFEPQLSAAYLIFLATIQEYRNKGYGTQFYTELVKRLKNNKAELLIFEVEKPEVAENTHLARRRIAWYKRQGAFLLRGVENLVEGGETGLPPLPLLLMVHPFTSLTVEAIFRYAQALFPNTLQQVGPLSLV